MSAKRRPAPKKRRTASARKRRPQSTALAPASRRVGVREVGVAELRALKRDLERASGALGGPRSASPRWNADPDDVQRSVARLVLSLVEFLRKLLERQAIRRMDEGTLSTAEIEKIGVALMQLEKTLHAIAKRFGLTPQELNLDLGPLGRLH